MTIMPMTIVSFDTDAAILRGREQLLAALNPGGRGPEERLRRTAARARRILRCATPTECVFFVDTLLAMEAVPDEIVEVLLADAPAVALPLIEAGALSDRQLERLAERRDEPICNLPWRAVPACRPPSRIAWSPVATAGSCSSSFSAQRRRRPDRRGLRDLRRSGGRRCRSTPPCCAAPILPAHVVDRRAHRPAALAAAWMRDRIDRERMRHHVG